MPMKVAARDWPAISALFDQALDLPASERDHFVAGLAGPQAAYRQMLADLLADQRAVETQDFMQVLPRPGVVDDNESEAVAICAAAADSGRIVGPYRLLRELGRGGMGSVWLAERPDGLIKREVALKLPHPGLATHGFAERLIRERDILAALDHPHIARLYDAGSTAEGQPYIALAYVQGSTLIDHCDAQGLDLRQRLELFKQVLDAVQFAHTHLVIHRDLKPSNVLVDGQGQVHLLDFGIAKLMVDGLAEATALTLDAGQAMTPDYASPEQLAGGAITTASDVYALGVLLYELLAGVRPYRLQRSGSGSLAQALRETEIRRPSVVVRGVGASQRARALRGDLDTIVLKALKFDPDQRYATAQALQQDLQRHLEGQAVLARPDSMAYRVHRLAARHRLAVGLFAAVLLVMAAATLVSLRQASLARQQTRTAEAALGFLEEIFSANSANLPDPAAARKTTARELLDLGAQRVDSALADAPEARFRVLATLARMYDDLELRSEVLALQRKRVELARQMHGNADPAVASALVDLADAAGDNNRADLALEALDEAAAILDRQRDTGSMARARLTLAQAHRMLDESGWNEATLQRADDAVRLLRAFPASEDLVMAWDLKTSLHAALGQVDPARGAAAEALRAAQSLPGGLSARLAYLLYISQADVERQAGNIEGAQHQLERALAAAEAKSGARSPAVLNVSSELGYLMVGASQYGQAVKTLGPAAELATALDAAGNVSTLNPETWRRYAAALLRFGRPEDALAALRESDRLRHGQVQVDEQVLLLNETASAQTELGQFEAAGAALDRADQILAAGANGRDRQVNAVLLDRVRLHLAKGQAAQAQAALDAFLPDPRTRTDSRPGWTRALLESEIHLASRDNKEAVRLATAVLTGLGASPLRAQLRDIEFASRLTAGIALLRAGDFGLALGQLQGAARLGAAIYDPQRSLRLARALLALAECEVKLGHRAKAFGHWSAARDIQASHVGLGPRHAEALRRLADLLKRAG